MLSTNRRTMGVCTPAHHEVGIMDKKEIVEQLKTLIVDRLGLEDRNPAEMGDDQRLLEGDLEIDSVDILQLVLDIERQFGIKLVTAKFERDTWKTVGSLATAIEARLQDAGRS